MIYEKYYKWGYIFAIHHSLRMSYVQALDHVSMQKKKYQNNQFE